MNRMMKRFTLLTALLMVISVVYIRTLMKEEEL